MSSFLKKWRKDRKIGSTNIDCHSLKSKNSTTSSIPNSSATSMTHNLLSSHAVKQFTVNLNEPHRIWKPKEYLAGETMLELRRDITNFAVKLSLVSEITVKTRGNGPATMKSKKTVRLIEKSTYLYGGQYKEHKSNDNITTPTNNEVNNEGNNYATSVTNDDIKIGLTKGTHKFPFRIRVPNTTNKKLFSSIKFERGSISYFLQCSLESINDLDCDKQPLAKCETDFQVIVPLDVTCLNKERTKSVVLQSASMVDRLGSTGHSSTTNTDAISSTFTNLTSTNNSGLSSSSSSKSGGVLNKTNSMENKTVTISVSLPSSGFVIGEAIPVKINLKHYKEYYHLAGIITTLVRICRVGGDEPLETFRKDICQNVTPLYVDSESLEFTTTVYLKVPLDAFSTFHSMDKMFSFQYYVEVIVNLSRKNLVYTESNKIIGGGEVEDDTSSSKFNKIGSLQKKVLTLVNNQNKSTKEDIESMLSFNDMVNVENLKRLRNVTGMSIEIVVGTMRSDSNQNSKPEDSAREISRIEGLQLSRPSTILARLHSQESRSPTSDLNYWLTSGTLDSLETVPQYTEASDSSNRAAISDTIATDDKQELEQQRLRALESQPPDQY